MASWVLAHPPWHSLTRVRLRWDTLVNAGGWMRAGRHFVNTPTLSLAVNLNEETPAMRQMKAYPYPSHPPDASLFEETTNEYATLSAKGEEKESALFDIPPGSPPCMLLRHLIRAARYEDAERVYTELMEMNVEIHPHPVYHFIARRVLSTPGLAPQKRLEAFVKWWSLVPASEEVTRSVGFILTEILRKDHTPDIPLIAHFALLAASKGYATQIAPDTISTVARYSPPDFTQRFLEQFCIAVWNYETKLTDPQHLKRRAQTLTQLHFRAWYSVAILSLVDCRRYRPALQLLELTASRDIWVTQSTYKHLAFSLQADGRLEDASAVERTQRQQNFAPGIDKDPFVPSARQRRAHIIVPSSEDYTELARSARSIKRALHRKLAIPAPHLAKVFLTFLTANRQSALRRLRNLAYRAGPLVISSWALAEMMCYAKPHRNHLDSLLHVFEYHFDHVGVPTEIFKPIYFSEHRLDLSKMKVRTVGLHRIGPLPPIRRRLAPTRDHMYLLWRMVVENAQRPATVARLYREFVDAITSSYTAPRNAYPLPHLVSTTRPTPSPPSKIEESSVEYLQPIPPRALYDRRIFGVFIDKFFSFGFLSYATRVVVDMFHLQSVPNEGTLDKFANGLQFKPDLAAVERRLGYWERTVARARAWTPHIADRPASPDLAEATRQRMLLFFYRATIRTLVREGRREDAAHVAARFLELVPAGPAYRKALEEELLEPLHSEASTGHDLHVGLTEVPSS